MRGQTMAWRGCSHGGHEPMAQSHTCVWLSGTSTILPSCSMLCGRRACGRPNSLQQGRRQRSSEPIRHRVEETTINYDISTSNSGGSNSSSPAVSLPPLDSRRCARLQADEPVGHCKPHERHVPLPQQPAQRWQRLRPAQRPRLYGRPRTLLAGRGDEGEEVAAQTAALPDGCRGQQEDAREEDETEA